jgi:hypothetical protein
MSVELIVLNQTPGPSPMEIHARLRRMASILKAIEAGELLAALPPCPLAQENHMVALDLLATLEVEINTLADELE